MRKWIRRHNVSFINKRKLKRLLTYFSLVLYFKLSITKPLMPETKGHQTIVSLCVVCVVFYLLGLLWPVCGFIIGVFVQERNPTTSQIILENITAMATLPTQWVDNIVNIIPKKSSK